MDKWLFRNFNPVIKAVSAGCNLRCGYCFYSGNQPEIKAMRPEVLRAVIARCLEVSPAVKFTWHGGEPTLAGIGFYQEAVALENELRHPNQRVTNTIQTNATIITREWTDFFLRSGFGVGVSIDGPERLHNFARRNAAGLGSFREMLSGMQTLRDGRVKFGAIAVVNSFTVDYPEEIFWFMRGLGLSFSANSCVARPSDPNEVRNLAISPTRYTEFLLRLSDLWFELDDPKFRIRPLEDVVKGVLGRSPSLCRYTGSCSRYVTVDYNGEVYPCDEFLEPKYLLGNLEGQSIAEILASQQATAYYFGRAATQVSCGACEWLRICKGGCMREWDGRKSIADPRNEEFCQARKMLFAGIQGRLASLGYSRKVEDNEPTC